VEDQGVRLLKQINHIDKNFFDPHLVASCQNIDQISDRFVTGINPVSDDQEQV
jgi:hypothetical protein